MFKFLSGVAAGIVVGGVGLFALELVAIIALEDSPELRKTLSEHLAQ